MKVAGMYHYPVKGLSPQPLERVDLEPGKGFPFDRVYGIARHDSGYDPAIFKPLPKSRFIVLVKEDRLAGLETHFDTLTHSLQIRVQGQLVLEARLDTEAGRESVTKFFSDMFDLSRDHRPIVAVGGLNRFTDISVHSELMMNGISIINLDTVKDFESKIGSKIDPLRFRGNLYIKGLPAYRELDLLGEEITIGPARLRIFRRTRRCAATDVNPVTARRDMTLPRQLMRHLGHADMGVYAEVIEGGTIQNNSRISLR